MTIPHIPFEWTSLRGIGQLKWPSWDGWIHFHHNTLPIQENQFRSVTGALTSSHWLINPWSQKKKLWLHHSFAKFERTRPDKRPSRLFWRGPQRGCGCDIVCKIHHSIFFMVCGQSMACLCALLCEVLALCGGGGSSSARLYHISTYTD